MRKAKQQKTGRQALIVLGMHRTGTSAISGTLAKLGAQPPRTLMPPTGDNPLGYWESTELMKFHDEVLESAGTCWSDWDSFNNDWIDSAVGLQFQARLPALLEQEFGSAGLLLIKDPRLCRFLPLWLRVLDELEITPKIVIPVRNPHEVARSLETRDHFSRKRSQLIWLRHILDAEANSRNLARVFVGYADVLDDWRTQVKRISGALDIKWPRWSGSVEAEIDQYLSEELRHHKAPEKRPTDGADPAGWIARTYQAAQALTSDPEQPEILAEFDAIRQEFDSSSAIYGSVVHEQRIQFEQQIASLDSKLSGTSRELQELTGRHNLLQQENVANYELAMGYKRARDDVTAQLEAREAAVNESNSREAAYNELAAAHESMRIDLTSQLQAREATLGELVSTHEARQAELSSQLESREEAYNELAAAHESMRIDLTSQLQTREATIDELTSTHQARLAELSSQLQSREAAYDELAAAHESMRTDLTSQLRSRDATIDELSSAHRAELDAVDSRLGAEIKMLREGKRLAEESIQERFAETAKLTELVLSLEEKLTAQDASARNSEANWHLKVNSLERQVDQMNDSLGAGATRINSLERSLDEGERKIRALELELEAHRQLVSDYRSRLEAIQSSRYWKFGESIKRISRGPQTLMLEYQPADDELLRESGLFDINWYRIRYPDVESGGMDPVIHYLLHGSDEGRDPGPAFSTNDYKARYPDVASTGLNPLVHYIKYGRTEGRTFARTGSENS